MTSYLTPEYQATALRGMTARLAAGNRRMTRAQQADYDAWLAGTEAPDRTEPPMTSPTLERMRAAQDTDIQRAEQIMAEAGASGRDLSDGEERELAAIAETAQTRKERIESMETSERERADAARFRAPYEHLLGREESRSRTFTGGGSHVYGPHEPERSMLRDVVAAGHGDADAADRLRHSNKLTADAHPEYRAGTTGSTSMGSFIPPTWVLDEIATLARAGRATADRFTPGGEPTSNSMTIPRITTGSLTTTQVTENSSLGTQDLVSAQITLATSTIGGYVDTSVQSVELGDFAVDKLLFADLFADYNRALDSQCIIGTGANNQLLGLDTVTGVNAVTSVQASPTVALVLPRIADAIQQVHTGRFLPPDGILMHPRRWGWILAAVDTAGRPLIDAEGNGQNSTGISDAPRAEGSVGTLDGLPVFTDANVPTTITSTQDEIYVARFSDGILFESAPRLEQFRDVGSGTATVRFRIYSFCSLFAGRYPAGISRIRGTGLAAPSFGT